VEVIRRRFLSLAAAAAAAPFAVQLARPQVEVPSTSQGSHFDFPGVQWEAASPLQLGWSIQGLADAYQVFATLPPASMVVVNRGRIVVAWGDSARRVKLSSIRKSLLNALYGTPVHDGRINLDDTLEELAIDDDPPLTQREKQATLRTLLQSRSGVYHSYVGGTPDMRERMPAREGTRLAPSGTITTGILMFLAECTNASWVGKSVRLFRRKLLPRSKCKIFDPTICII
jgi:CubicO group peptidase (beta-lactamase class C family)